MNSFLKYIIYFLLGLMIHFLLKNNLVEGYGEHVFPLFSRIMGSENGDYRGPYMGCKKYECDNIYKYSFKELNSKALDELKGILREMSNETRLTAQEITSISKENSITEILKIDKANNYFDKEVNTNLDYLTCNNEMEYSSASLLGGINEKWIEYRNKNCYGDFFNIRVSDDSGISGNPSLIEGQKTLQECKEICNSNIECDCIVFTGDEQTSGDCYLRKNCNIGNCDSNNDFNTYIYTQSDNRCNHQKCCFNTKCSSQDVQSLTEDDGTSLSCINGTVFKKNANCLNEIECKDNYQLHCCTNIIDSNSEFNEISGDDEFISKGELTIQYQGLTSAQMDKILSISDPEENINLDEYDFYSLQ